MVSDFMLSISIFLYPSYHGFNDFKFLFLFIKRIKTVEYVLGQFFFTTCLPCIWVQFSGQHGRVRLKPQSSSRSVFVKHLQTLPRTLRRGVPARIEETANFRLKISIHSGSLTIATTEFHIFYNFGLGTRDGSQIPNVSSTVTYILSPINCIWLLTVPTIMQHSCGYH